MSALRVLHVDDEPDIREVVELSLGLDPELSLKSCSSGRDGVEAAANWNPDLILLDVMMPVMDGPTTLAHLRGKPETAAIPVVFMTARAQPRELDHFVSLGAEGVIAKPFDPMTLAASVRNYAGNLHDTIAARRTGFIQRTKASLADLQEQRAALGDTEGLGELRTRAHKLAGGAGVFGLDQLSAAAASLEEAIVERLDGKDAPLESALDALIARIRAL